MYLGEIGADKDHVHLLIQSVPNYSPTQIIKIVKSITAKEVLAPGESILNGIETVIVIHECSEEKLVGQFPRGRHALPDEVYKELKYVPGHFEVHEHHIRVYARQTSLPTAGSRLK